jgi:hypothetical protein
MKFNTEADPHSLVATFSMGVGGATPNDAPGIRSESVSWEFSDIRSSR